MSWLRRAVFGSLMLKGAALVCAAALWVYVDSLLMTAKTVSVEATLVHEDGRPVAGRPEAPFRIRVTVRGPGAEMDRVSPRTVSCVARVPDVLEGEEAVALVTTDCVVLPKVARLRVVSVEPRAVDVRIHPEAGHGEHE